MKYVNREMKIDQLIGYFNQGKINLIPPFQRGTVWPLALRRALISNMVRARPIPAIFLYKQASGSQFAYAILDGKQRLESLILFVGDKRKGISVSKVEDYFFKSRAIRDVNFKIAVDGSNVGFHELDDELVRTFLEYTIPTIEIDLDDEAASFDEIIKLFVDINQYGVKVKRFEVVRALGKDKLFSQVRGLVAIEQRRKSSRYYRAKSKSPFVSVLGQLTAIKRIDDNNSRVDRMWERLTEIAMFLRTGTHRRPADLLDAFIRQDQSNRPLSKPEVAKLRRVIDFLRDAYKASPSLRQSRLATDQAHFYTVATTLLSDNLIDSLGEDELIRKLTTISDALAGKHSHLSATTVKHFTDLSLRGTTDPSRRRERGVLLRKMIDAG